MLTFTHPWTEDVLTTRTNDENSNEKKSEHRPEQPPEKFGLRGAPSTKTISLGARYFDLRTVFELRILIFSSGWEAHLVFTVFVDAAPPNSSSLERMLGSLLGIVRSRP